jgi:hypothetical protein
MYSDSGIEAYEQYAERGEREVTLVEFYQEQVPNHIGSFVNMLGEIDADDVCELTAGKLLTLQYGAASLADESIKIVMRCARSDMPLGLRVAAWDELEARHAKAMQPWVIEKAQGDL